MMKEGRRAPPTPRGVLPPRVSHGGPDLAELQRLGIRPDYVLDFSVNTNPLGAAPKAADALLSVDPSRYPDNESLLLREALAALHAVRLEEVLVGNGSVELIWLLAQVYLQPADVALIVGPTFGEYEAAVMSRSAEPVRFEARAEDTFTLRLEELLELARSVRPRVIFLCNPNNPTGQAVGLEDLVGLLDVCDETLLVVDEAYQDLADDVASAITPRRDARTVVLRSLTKNFGLPGLRLGYLVAMPSVVQALSRARPPWTVNALAQAAGLAVLDDRSHVEEGRRLARQAKGFLFQGLGRLGKSCVPSQTNFWLVQVQDAAELRTALLRRGLLVRDCTSFGLPGYIRLAARPLWECQRLLEAFESEVPRS